MAEKMFGRIPSVTPQVSWFEFLLDKTGKLLKDHIATRNAGKDIIFNMVEMSKSRQKLDNMPSYRQLWCFCEPNSNEASLWKAIIFLNMPVYMHFTHKFYHLFPLKEDKSYVNFYSNLTLNYRPISYAVMQAVSSKVYSRESTRNYAGEW